MRYSVSLTLTVLTMAAMEFCVFHPATGQSPSAADVRQFGAKGDGETDDTAAIQRAVDSSRGGVWLPRGEYRITAAITIDLDRVGLASIAGDGTGRLVMAGPGPAIRFLGTHQGSAAPATFLPNVWQRQRMPVVDNLEIIGAHAEAVGIEASGTMQLTVTRVNIRRALHAIHLVDRNRNVIISECHLYENDGVGLYLDDVNLHQINVAGCHISYNRGGGIVSRGGNVRNLHITGCDIEANMGEQSPPTANVLIDCTGGEYGTAEIAITGCTIQHSHQAPDSANIRYIGADAKDRAWGNFAITGNVLSDVQVNIDLQRARGVVITGNTFWSGFQADLRVSDSSNITIGPNNFDRNPGYFPEGEADGGISLRNCRDCTLNGLHVNGVRRKAAAIVIEDCRRINVSGCTVLDSDSAGLLLKNVDRSRVSGCLFDHENLDGWTPINVEGGRENCIEPGDMK